MTNFILRAGGDVLSTMLMDAVFLWVAGVLVSTILSTYTSLSLITLYLIVESLDIIKLIIAIFFFKKERWVKNIAVVYPNQSYNCLFYWNINIV